MPPRSDMKTSRSARILFLSGAAVGLFGLLWAVCFIVSQGRFPIDGAGNGNLLIALVLLISGVVLVLVGAGRDRVPKV